MSNPKAAGTRPRIWHRCKGHLSPIKNPAPGAVHFDPIVITNPAELRQFPIFSGFVGQTTATARDFE